MQIISSDYWSKKRHTRPNITDDMIEYCIHNSNKLKDKSWGGVLNAIARIPPSGRLLKVVYREKW